jgi:ABC-type Fe3+/spermidine/putrescine transport system ATPase subunit
MPAPDHLPQVQESSETPKDLASEREGYEVVLRGVSHCFGSNRVLDDVSLSIKKGEFFGILGPSGSGKTTTMRIIRGFVIPTEGEVYLENEPAGRRPLYRRNVTMVFQHLALFPHMSVFDNLSYGLKLRGISRLEKEEKVKRMLDVVHLAGFEARYPKQLSGGQQQRVALARALILEPGVVLFDEPLGSLDLKLRREMQIEIKNIQRRLGTTFIYVTHDQQEALNMCDRIAIMNNGRIEQIGTAEEIYEHPRTRFVADFIGDTNLLEGTILSREGAIATLESEGVRLVVGDDDRFQVGDRVALSIRPERILIGPHSEQCSTRFSGRIVDLTYSGARRRCTLELQTHNRLKVDLDARAASDLNVGDEVMIGWNAKDGSILSDGGR